MFWERFSVLCAEKGVKPGTVARTLGFSNALCTQWKQGKQNPSYNKLSKIAEYFNVSLDYFSNEQRPSLPNAEINTEYTYYRPIYESVSAGYGMPGDNIAVGLMPLYIYNPADVEDTICIKVSGDSMYPKIENGDIIVIHKQDTLRSGEIGVVRLDDEFFVKRVEIEDNALRLVSINPEYAPKLIQGPDLDRAAIVGKVVKIVKDL